MTCVPFPSLELLLKHWCERGVTIMLVFTRYAATRSVNFHSMIVISKVSCDMYQLDVHTPVVIDLGLLISSATIMIEIELTLQASLTVQPKFLKVFSSLRCHV